MFELIQSGPERVVDCTAPYNVRLDKEYTLKEFINAVLTSRSDERGNIYIAKRNCSWYNYPKIKYRYGQIVGLSCPDFYDICDRKIKEVSASGGCTVMDYTIKFKGLKTKKEKN